MPRGVRGVHMDETMNAAIVGMGWFLPKKIRGNDYWSSSRHRRSQEALSKDMLTIERNVCGDDVDISAALREATRALGDDPFQGARQRHVLGEDEEVSDMEAEATRRALRAAGIRPDKVDLILVSSTVPDLLLPLNAPA